MLIKGATGRCPRTDCRLTKGNTSPPMVFLCWHITRSFFYCPFYCIKCIFPWRFRKAMALHNWALETISPPSLDSYLIRIPAICYQQIPELTFSGLWGPTHSIHWYVLCGNLFHWTHSIEPIMCWIIWNKYNTGLILCLHPANERRRYQITPSLIGWAQT